MVRRTKEDAQETRNRILDAAESVFERRGVSRTTLNEIAEAAGVTRGAIYWHFEHKADIFDAMMLRVMLPLEQSLQREDDTDGGDSMARLRQSVMEGLARIVDDSQMRRVFEIAIHKVEYVDELATVRLRRLEGCTNHTRRIEQAIAVAIRQGRLSGRMPADRAALGLHALVDGLFQSWMLDPTAFDLVDVGGQVFDTYVAGLAVGREH